MLPIFLSIIEASIPNIVPFIVKPRFLKAVLIGNFILYIISLIFLFIFEILKYKSCYYVQNFIKAFLILVCFIALLVAVFLAECYCKVKKIVNKKYNKEINDLYDLD